MCVSFTLPNQRHWWKNNLRLKSFLWSHWKFQCWYKEPQVSLLYSHANIKCVSTYLNSTLSLHWRKVAVFQFASMLLAAFWRDLLFISLLLAPLLAHLLSKVFSQISSLKWFPVLAHDPSISTRRSGVHQL